ncbi:MAG: ribonuclease catalytic domain-containing protein [Gammaproteobacteria bacterium]|nr:ribonuclease catalytic domain-containing protein [Gammaproteobacteria bacterium]
MVNSLVAYKGKPAKILSQTTHKFELLFEDGSTLRVREKDFRLVHPDFIKVQNADNADNSTDYSILSEFQGELLSIKELTEWLFEDYSPQNAWNVYLLVDDGLYFYWQKDKVFVRECNQVDSIKAKRESEHLEAESIKSCVENINNNTFTEDDLIHIEAISRVALNRSKHAKILQALGVENSPEEAHRLLLKLNYYNKAFNPYPDRNQILIDEQLDITHNDVNRTDLTHLKSYAIDNKNSSDADDAISIDKDNIWVHIADVSSVVEANSELDIYAQERASNLYLPGQIIHMLPESVTYECSLGSSETSKALSVGFSINGDEIVDIKIIHSIIKVKKISYDEANLVIDSDKNLAELQKIVNQHKSYRKKNGAISLDLPNVDVRINDNKVSITQQHTSPSRELIAEMMVMAGRAVAKFSIDNDISMPFAVQDDGEFPQDILDRSDSLSLSESFNATKYFKRSAISTKIRPHSGLGLESYLRVTSPLRRYLDLLVHQQLSNFITEKKTLGDGQIKKIITKINSIMPAVNRTVRTSNEHYKCLYLLQNRDWVGEGVVVDTRGDKAVIIIPSIGMLAQVKLKTQANLDDKVNLKAINIDLCKLSVDFNKV